MMGGVPPPWRGSIGRSSESTRSCGPRRPGLPLASFASGSAGCRASCAAGSTSLRTTRRCRRCSNACSSSGAKWPGRAARPRPSSRGGAPRPPKALVAAVRPRGPRRAATSRPARPGHPPRDAGPRGRRRPGVDRRLGSSGELPRAPERRSIFVDAIHSRDGGRPAPGRRPRVLRVQRRRQSGAAEE